LNVLTKLSRASFDAFGMERNRDSPDSRARTAIALSLNNTRRNGLARSKGTNLQFPASAHVEFDSPARSKDNANSFGSRVELTAGMLLLFARYRNRHQRRQPDRPLALMSALAVSPRSRTEKRLRIRAISKTPWTI